MEVPERKATGVLILPAASVAHLHSGEATWRASLENPQTGERHGFASLDAMVAFLRRQSASPRKERARKLKR